MRITSRPFGLATAIERIAIGAGNYHGLDGMIANNFASAVRRLLLSGNPEEPTTVAA